jgi:outer membrane protein
MWIKRKIKLVSYLLSVILLPGCVLFAGCSHILAGKDRYANKVPQEKLQQINILELKEIKDNEGEKITGEVKDEKAHAELKLSLEECRALTLENNFGLKVQLIEPSIEAERVNEQEAKFEALFSVDAEYSKTNSPSASYLDEISGSKRDKIDVEPGVRIPLRSGGTLNFRSTDIREKNNSLFSIYNPTYSSDFTASISQPLLRNAGKRTATYVIQLAEYNRQIVDAQTKQVVINTIAMAERAYWSLYAARRLLDVRRQEYNLAKDLFEESERLVELGSKSEIELLRTQAGVASSFENIIKAENTVRNMERNFKWILNKPGLSIKTDTALIITTEPDPVHYEFDKEKIVTQAIENRMDMLEMELRLAWDESTIEYSRNQLYPFVNLYYAYNINSIGETRRDSYDMLFDNKYIDHTVNLYASIPLGNKAAKSSLRQATYERAKQLASMENKKALIEYEVLRGIDQLEASWQHILASAQTTIHSDRQYKAEKRQYELGMRTSNDVLQAQTDLANAKIMEIYALTRYQIDLIDLAYTTGTLLGASKIDLEPIVPENR